MVMAFSAIERVSKLWFLNWPIWIMRRASVLARNEAVDDTVDLFRGTGAGNALSIPHFSLPSLFCIHPVLGPGNKKVSKSRSPPPRPVVGRNTHREGVWEGRVQHCLPGGVREDFIREGSLNFSLKRWGGIYQGWRASCSEHTKKTR